MKKNKDSLVITVTTALTGSALVAVSLTGMLSDGFYNRETTNWQIQSLGQDMIDLFLVTPALLVTGTFARKNNPTARLLWAGTLLYIIYTFFIYCFDVHFNILFPVYCLILGISVYAFFRITYSQYECYPVKRIISNGARNTTGIYFISVSAVFYLLWMADIATAILHRTIPENVVQSGLPTNPVHVLDLSLFLPATFITGILLLRRKPAGLILSPILLWFFILMDVTIGWLAFKMKSEGLSSGNAVIIAMSVLGGMSIVLLLYNLTRRPFGNDPRSERGLESSPVKPAIQK